MSLSGIFGSKNAVDGDLDAIFKSSAGPSKIAATHNSAQISQPKAKSTDEKPKKSKKRVADDERERAVKKVRMQEIDDVEKPKPKTSMAKKSKADKRDKEKPAEHVAAEPSVEGSTHRDDVDATESTVEDDADSDSSQIPQHETTTKKSNKRSAKKPKFIPADETKEQKDARTVFIGNLPAEIVKSRPLEKKLRRHITTLVPLAGIESIRFRSVPFKNPTSKLDNEDDEEIKKVEPSTKDQRQQRRAADWRSNRKEEEEEAEVKKDEKSYMTPGQKRRLAFIKGDIHENAARVNAYVVFAYAIPPEQRSANVPYKDILDPFEAAKAVKLACEGSTFEEHTLHTDFVGKTPMGTEMSGLDPKLSIFVGNLDFASSDEDLRAFFEALLCTERGSSPEEVDGERRSNTWVTSVRIVRDRETQLGKGFGYVQLLDRECVDELLALEATKLKFAKRTLRVQRCKTLLGGKVKVSNIPSKSSSDNKKAASRPAVPPPVSIPKGDPTLGDRLSGLSKDARKEAKSTDADRVARRLAKKKAKHSLEKAGVKSKDDMKLRMRERKGGKGTVNTGRKAGKGRMRSDRAASKKNVKKQ